MRKLCFIILALTMISTSAHGQSFLSVNDLLSIRKCLINKKQSVGRNILDKRGYTKSLVYGPDQEDIYLYQNCRLVEIGGAYSSDGEYLKADRKTENASYVHISYAAIGVFVHSKTRAQTWINQIKALGYRQDANRRGQDRFGADYYYIKRGSPELRIVFKDSAYKLEVARGD